MYIRRRHIHHGRRAKGMKKKEIGTTEKIPQVAPPMFLLQMNII
jgi:hypothetical protein